MFKVEGTVENVEKNIVFMTQFLNWTGYFESEWSNRGGEGESVLNSQGQIRKSLPQDPGKLNIFQF